MSRGDVYQGAMETGVNGFFYNYGFCSENSSTRPRNALRTYNAKKSCHVRR
jgi:hypothetical protein